MNKGSPYWNRIDIHSHTLGGITTDKEVDDYQYTHQKFYDFLFFQSVKLKAVTNHNTLRIADHVKQAVICHLLGITYIPGVELDCNVTGKAFHAIALFNPRDDIVALADKINKYTDSKKADSLQPKIEFTEKDLNDVFSNESFIFIVHAIKSQGMMYSGKGKDTPEDLKNQEWAVNAIRNALAAPFLFENTKAYHVYSVVERIKRITNDENIIIQAHHAVVGSDYKFDSNKEIHDIIDKKPKYAIFSKPTYRGLEIAIRNYQTRFSEESEIVLRHNFVTQIEFVEKKNENFDLSGSIECSPSLNAIIGNSGSGKTLLLNEIYRGANPGTNLSVSSVKKSKNLSDDIYADLTDNEPILRLRTFSAEPLVAVEIPKIYNELLKAQGGTDIASLFGISDNEASATVLSDYSSSLGKAYSYHLSMAEKRAKGSDSLNNIVSCISFIRSNENEARSFLLSPIPFSDSLLKELERKRKGAEEIISKESQVIEYFLSLKTYLAVEKGQLVDDLIKSYKAVIEEISAEKEKTIRSIDAQKEKQAIFDCINRSIQSSIEMLGNREKEVANRAASKTSFDQDLASCVGEYLKAKYYFSSTDCAFPLEKIRSSIAENGANEYARIQERYVDSDMKGTDLSASRIFDFNRKTKYLKGISDFDISTEKGAKKLVSALAEAGLNLADCVNRKVIVTSELNIDGVWKDQNDINPGSLAKTYMDFYFRDLIRKKNPDVVFIDQPENDVDKSFITDTLCRFILEKKTSIQFFITTHEPIIAVNSDANLIIKARDKTRKAISYYSFSVEDSDQYTYRYIGTDEVAKTLDGGKNNVIVRNQIYGGSIDE